MSIQSLIEQVAPKTAIIFSSNPPRLLGTLNAIPATAEVARRIVDPILFSQRLSATYISIAEYTPTGAKFVVARG